MSDAFANGLFLLAGVVLGFGLNEGAWWFRHLVLERREKRSIRIALQREYEHNRAALLDLWRRITMEPSPSGTFDEQRLEKYYRLATATMPRWSHLLWESNAAKLTRVLDDNEFQVMLGFHTSLDTFAVQQIVMREAFAGIRHEIVKGKGEEIWFALSDKVQIDEFLNDKFPAWSKCDEIHAMFQGREVAIKLDQ